MLSPEALSNVTAIRQRDFGLWFVSVLSACTNSGSHSAALVPSLLCSLVWFWAALVFVYLVEVFYPLDEQTDKSIASRDSTVTARFKH
jgi:hypothetical protein